MKSAILPPLRVDPRIKRTIQAVLKEGETLSSFMLEAVTQTAAMRRAQQAFVAKAEARSRKAARTGKFVSSEAVFSRLEQILTRKRRPTAR